MKESIKGVAVFVVLFDIEIILFELFYYNSMFGLNDCVWVVEKFI